MKILYYYLVALSVILSVSTANATMITYSWTGTVINVDEDDGTGIYAGTQVGDTFSGSFIYDPILSNTIGQDTSDGNFTIDPVDTWARYFLGSANGMITNGTTQVTAANANLFIVNDHPVGLSEDDDYGGEEAVSELLGSDVPGTPVDAWALTSLSGNFEFSVDYVSLLTTLYDDLSLRPTSPWSLPGSPPDPDNQIALFSLFEIDGTISENTTFSAIGNITLTEITVTEVPEPPSFWLFSYALCAMAWIRRKALNKAIHF